MRPIDADTLMEECYEELKDDSLWHDEDTSKDYADGNDEGKRIMMAIIDQAPTIDAVNVVRCKDCWHGKRIDSADGVFTHMCDISDLKWRADDFCSYGEREGK